MGRILYVDRLCVAQTRATFTEDYMWRGHGLGQFLIHAITMLPHVREMESELVIECYAEDEVKAWFVNKCGFEEVTTLECGVEPPAAGCVPLRPQLSWPPRVAA